MYIIYIVSFLFEVHNNKKVKGGVSYNMNTVLITDSCSDLPLEFVENSNIKILNLTVHFKDKEYKDDFGKTIKYKDFYSALRKGEITTTSQINAQTYVDAFKEAVSLGNSVIYLGFSSALSGCVSSATLARNIVLEEYKDADISIIDTKSASLGEGLIVYKAYNMLQEGCTKEEVINWVENNKLKVNHWFTVDDLKFLTRGGRVSQGAAQIGTLLNIKPILNVNNEGKLIPQSKVSGRKRSLKVLANMLLERAVNPEKQTIFISHGDCYEDAEFLKNFILEKISVENVIINNVGPVIGSHSGPGTVALFFLGSFRE
jgi:DegV family protein with EDD domain